MIKEQIKNTLRIEELISEVIPLTRRSNKEYVGAHHTHTSDSGKSFHVDTEQQLYHCFNCQEAGDIFSWQMYTYNQTFPQALQTLALKAGIDLPDWTPEQRQRQEDLLTERQHLEAVFLAAARYYHNQLTPDISSICSEKWGLDKDTIDLYKIGFSPIGNNLLNTLQPQFDISLLEKSGLFVRTKYGLKDLFQGRIIFPYWQNLNTNTGIPSYFIGRQTEHTPNVEWEAGKYRKQLVHSDKHPYVSEVVTNEHFYGEHSLRSSRGDTLVITEGVTDCIAVLSKDIPCISPVTTSFREADWPRLLAKCRLAKRVVIINDNEANNSGKKGALKTGKFLSKNGIDVRIGELPRGDKDKIDIAEYLKAHTREEFELVIKEAKTIFQIYLDQVSTAAELDKADLAKPIYSLMAAMDPIRKGQAEKALQKAFGGPRVISVNAIRKMVEEAANKPDDTEQPTSRRFFRINDSGQEEFIPSWLGKYITDNDSYFYSGSSLYKYQDGVYKRNAESILNTKIQDLLGDRWRKKHWDQAVTWVTQNTFIDTTQLPENEGYINVKNGMYDIVNGKLLPHSADYKSTIQHPVTYNPDAKCERLEQFVNEVFPADTIPVVWEFAGYCLLPVELRKALILTGSGANGKSIWLQLLEKALGKEYISHESLQDLGGGNKFSIAELHGKVANIYGDLESEAVKYTGTLKMLTGGDEIHAERKNQQPFYFRNRAKLIFSCNTLPIVFDYNEAFFDRMLIIDCPNKFVQGKNADPDLIAKLTTEEALSTWLNYAIEGAERLLANGAFTNSATVDRLVAEYRLHADNVAAFADACIMKTLNEHDFTVKEEIYKAYRNWCKEHGYFPVNEANFGKRTKTLGWVTIRPTTPSGNKPRAWQGIKLTDIAERKYG